jgi:hypothetical protein
MYSPDSVQRKCSSLRNVALRSPGRARWAPGPEPWSADLRRRTLRAIAVEARTVGQLTARELGLAAEPGAMAAHGYRAFGARLFAPPLNSSSRCRNTLKLSRKIPAGIATDVSMHDTLNAGVHLRPKPRTDLAGP